MQTKNNKNTSKHYLGKKGKECFSYQNRGGFQRGIINARKFAPFILELPNEEDNIVLNYQEIEQFVKKWKGRRVPHELIENINVGYKENLRINFFQKIIESHQRRSDNQPVA